MPLPTLQDNRRRGSLTSYVAVTGLLAKEPPPKEPPPVADMDIDAAEVREVGLNVARMGFDLTGAYPIFQVVVESGSAEGAAGAVVADLSIVADGSAVPDLGDLSDLDLFTDSTTNRTFLTVP